MTSVRFGAVSAVGILFRPLDEACNFGAQAISSRISATIGSGLVDCIYAQLCIFRRQVATGGRGAANPWLQPPFEAAPRSTTETDLFAAKPRLCSNTVHLG